MVKGEVRKLKFQPRVIDDDLVKAGLVSVNSLFPTEPIYLVGGMATQSYLPSLCRRPTSDIDFSVVRPLNNSEFKEMVKRPLEYLRDCGYDVDTVVRSRAYCIDVHDPETDSSLCIEFSRRNKKNIQSNGERLARELENSRSKRLEGIEGILYRVASPEDIAVPKLVRSIGALRRNGNLIGSLNYFNQPFNSKGVARRLKQINNLRTEAMINLGDLELAEKLRFVSDVYDVRLLSELSGFNLSYLNTSLNDWSIFSEDSFEVRKMRDVLPLED